MENESKNKTEYVTIPVAEYIYLQRVDALMDALLADTYYSNSQAVIAVQDAVKAMRNPGQAVEQ